MDELVKWTHVQITFQQNITWSLGEIVFQRQASKDKRTSKE